MTLKLYIHPEAIYLKAQSHWGTVWHGHTRKEQKPRTGNQRP